MLLQWAVALRKWYFCYGSGFCDHGHFLRFELGKTHSEFTEKGVKVCLCLVLLKFVTRSVGRLFNANKTKLPNREIVIWFVLTTWGISRSTNLARNFDVRRSKKPFCNITFVTFDQYKNKSQPIELKYRLILFKCYP